MDMQLVIPTHRRVNRQITLGNLTPQLRKRTILVVSDKEEQAELKSDWGNSVQGVFLAKGTSCIAEKRHWIMKNVDADAVFMMDDDLTFYTRCDIKDRRFDDGWRAKGNENFLNESSVSNLNTAFTIMQAAFSDDPRFAAVGMSSRMGNNRVESNWLENTRLMHAFGIHRERYLKHKIRFDSVKCREDFHVALCLLRLGYRNALLCDTCVNPGSYNAAGGASTERTMEQSNAEAQRLAELHPGFVRLAEKQYKSSVPRTEVVIQWKKAYGSGM